MTDKKEVKENLTAYVMGLLDPEEMLAIDDYLATHDDLDDELAEAESMAVTLSAAMPGPTPPDHVKSSLMARVYADSETMERPALSVVPQRDEPAPHRVEARPQRGNGGVWRWATLAAAACFLLALLYGMQANSQLSSVRDQLAASEQQIADRDAQLAALESTQADIAAERELLQGQLTETQAQLANLQDNLDASISERNSLQQINRELEQKLMVDDNQLAVLSTVRYVIPLPGTDEAPSADAILYASDEDGLIVWNSLDVLPDELDYQLWLIQPDGDVLPAGVFDVEADEGARAVVALPDGRDPYTAVAITVEPAGGSEVATSPIIMLGNVATTAGG